MRGKVKRLLDWLEIPTNPYKESSFTLSDSQCSLSIFVLKWKSKLINKPWEVDKESPLKLQIFWLDFLLFLPYLLVHEAKISNSFYSCMLITAEFIITHGRSSKIEKVSKITRDINLFSFNAFHWYSIMKSHTMIIWIKC